MIQTNRLTILIMVYLLISGFVSIDNLSTSFIEKQNVDKEKYYQYFEVESLPVLKYKNISRCIQPANQIKNNKPVFIRDSLLSVMLEESICCEIPCEGVFRYTLEFKISKEGFITDIIFVEDENNIDFLNKQIANVLKSIKYKPAIINSKSVGLVVRVNVLIDLYNFPSRMSRLLFYKK